MDPRLRGDDTEDSIMDPCLRDDDKESLISNLPLSFLLHIIIIPATPIVIPAQAGIHPFTKS